MDLQDVGCEVWELAEAGSELYPALQSMNSATIGLRGYV
jgi:hypothetical protein